MTARRPQWPPASLLGRLRPGVRDALLEIGTALTYSSRKIILLRGALSNHLILLISGAVKITVITFDGDEALLAIRVGGDLIGEMAAFDATPRSATVVAAGEVRAKHIKRVD
jgi:CRP/FNR family transcriptional regulator, cyclic AMP receptor protein